MKMRVFLAMAALVLLAHPCEGQVVANLRGDYLNGTVDGQLASFTAPMGSWLYISSGTRNPTSDPVLDTMIWTNSLNRYHFPDAFFEPMASLNPALAPDEVMFHPRNSASPPRFAVARWTADAAGTYFIDGHVRDFGIGGGDGIDFEIFVNGTPTFVSNGIFQNTAPFSFSTFLSAGSTVDFVIDPRSDADFDSTALSALVSVPEPSTWALLGLVALGPLAARYRTRKRPTTTSDSTDRRGSC